MRGRAGIWRGFGAWTPARGGRGRGRAGRAGQQRSGPSMAAAGGRSPAPAHRPSNQSSLLMLGAHPPAAGQRWWGPAARLAWPTSFPTCLLTCLLTITQSLLVPPAPTCSRPKMAGSSGTSGTAENSAPQSPWRGRRSAARAGSRSPATAGTDGSACVVCHFISFQKISF